MHKDIIKVLKEDVVFNQKDLIINFLEKEEYFYSVLENNDSDIIQSNNFILLGRELNILRKQIKYNRQEFKNLNEYLSYLGIRAILSLKYIPENFHNHILKQEFSGISDTSLDKIFKYLLKKYTLISTIYNVNGDIGLTKYITINKKIILDKGKTLSDLYIFKLLDIDDFIDITSNDANINKYKSSDVLKKIYKLKIVEIKKLFENDNTIINL